MGVGPREYDKCKLGIEESKKFNRFCISFYFSKLNCKKPEIGPKTAYQAIFKAYSIFFLGFKSREDFFFRRFDSSKLFLLFLLDDSSQKNRKNI